MDLYSAKKKENKITDLSTLSEAEKIALLNAYKQDFENQKASRSLSLANEEAIEVDLVDKDREIDDVVEEIDEIVDEIGDVVTTLQEDGEEVLEELGDLVKKSDVEVSGNSNDDNKSTTEENNSIKEEILDSNKDEEIEEIEESKYNGIPLQLINNDSTTELEENSNSNNNNSSNNSNRKDVFDYTSFTPYKPKFDDIELNNSLYTMGDMGMKVSVSANEPVEKYVAKTTKGPQNIKLSQNGSYKIADSYSSSKYRMEIPFLKIFIVIFGALSLGLFVTQFMYNYDKVLLTEYLCDMVFALAAFFTFMSAINKSDVVATLQGIALFLCLGLDLIFNGIEGYQRGIYMIVSPDGVENALFGTIFVVALVCKYAFILIAAISSLIGKQIINRISLWVGIVTAIMVMILFYMEYQIDNITWYYGIVPSFAGLFALIIAIILLENKKILD